MQTKFIFTATVVRHKEMLIHDSLKDATEYDNAILLMHFETFSIFLLVLDVLLFKVTTQNFCKKFILTYNMNIFDNFEKFSSKISN